MAKKKLSFDYIAKLGYFNFYRRKINNIPGYCYVLCNKLNDLQITEINSYNNTKIGVFSCMQAPEIKHDVVFLGDKCF